MLSELDSKIPKYLQVAQAIEGGIARRELTPGMRLPSERELAEQFAVSPVTVSRGLGELVRRRLLVRKVGSGTYIQEAAPAPQEPRGRVRPLRVGLVCHYAPDAEWYSSSVLQVANQMLGERGIDLGIFVRAEQDGLRLDDEQGVDGLILLAPSHAFLSQARRVAEAGIPLAMIGVYDPRLAGQCFTLNDVEEARQAVRYLVDKGHRRIGMACGYHRSLSALARLQGYRQGMWDAGLATHPQWVIDGDNVSHAAEYGLAQIEDALALPERPTAFLAAGYRMCLTIYKAAKNTGLRVPDDLSVMGFDDPPSGEHLGVPLTTIRQPLERMVQDACASLEAMMRGQPAPARPSYQGELVQRASCAPPPIDAAALDPLHR